MTGTPTSQSRLSRIVKGLPQSRNGKAIAAAAITTMLVLARAWLLVGFDWQTVVDTIVSVALTAATVWAVPNANPPSLAVVPTGRLTPEQGRAVLEKLKTLNPHQWSVLSDRESRVERGEEPDPTENA